MKLIIGSVHFGLKYGLENLDPVDSAEVRKILDFLIKKKINFIDTAISYGDSESLIGKFKQSNNFKVITKIPINVLLDIDNYMSWFNTQVILSKQRLNIDTLYGLLLHSPKDIFSFDKNKIRSFFDDQKNKNNIIKLGISVYTTEEAIKALSIYPFEIIQFPFNVFDRRFLDSGFISHAKSQNIELHARSVFLQGSLINIDHNSKLFKTFVNEFENWHHFINKNNISAVTAAINFVFNHKEIDASVIGVRSVRELNEILYIIENCKKQKFIKNFPKLLSSNNENLINPSLWRSL